MNPYDTTSLHARPEWRIQAARWFQEKWGIPLEEYLASIDESIRGTDPVPQWYIVTEGERIIAGHLLKHICRDMAAKGISPLYLITEHTSFYERYGWEYLCMVMGDDGEPMRMYRSPSARSHLRLLRYLITHKISCKNRL